MFLGLDLGTTNIKALVTQPDGTIVTTASAPVSLLHTPDGGIEQDIDEIWSATLSAMGRIDDPVLSGVKAVGVSAQGGAMQVLDGSGRPAGKVISWLDTRGRPFDTELTDRLGVDWFAEHTGHCASGIAPGQLLRLSGIDPSCIVPPNAIGFVGDVIVERLCGRRAHDATSLSITMLYNPGLHTEDPALLDVLGIGKEQLPVMVSPREAAGALLGDVAGQTGLPEGIPVSAAIHDQYASSLGVGASGPGDMMLGTGTAWVLLATVAQLAPPVISGAFACRHVFEGLYGQMLSMVNGGSAVEWVHRVMGAGTGKGDTIDDTLHKAPAGSSGVRFQPLLTDHQLQGLAPDTRGRLSGLRLSHGSAHILRAAVEGLACELARYLRALEAGGVPVTRLAMCGGAAGGTATPQILADVTGLPVSCTSVAETSAFGAAILAKGLVERDADLASLSGQMVPGTRLVEPGDERDLYSRMLEEYEASLSGKMVQPSM